MTVGLVDERGELAGCYQGVPQNDVGMRTDVLDGVRKQKECASDPFNVTDSRSGGRAWQRRGFPGSGVGDSLWLHTSCNSTWKFTRRHHGAAFFSETEKYAGF